MQAEQVCVDCSSLLDVPGGRIQSTETDADRKRRPRNVPPLKQFVLVRCRSRCERNPKKEGMWQFVPVHRGILRTRQGRCQARNQPFFGKNWRRGRPPPESACSSRRRCLRWKGVVLQAGRSRRCRSGLVSDLPASRRVGRQRTPAGDVFSVAAISCCGTIVV